MEKKLISWLEISDSQKTKLVSQAKNFLRQQVVEAKYSVLVAEIFHL